MAHDIRIAELEQKDIPGVIECIQKAFADDPYNNWIFDTEKFSAKRNSISLDIRCRWGIRNAMFFVAKDIAAKTVEEREKVLGVSMWMPPREKSKGQTWGEWADDWRVWFEQVFMNMRYGRGGLRVDRYFAWKRAQAEVQEELWTDPHGYYFCNIVTVLPDAQGMGIGRELFRRVTDVADAEGRPCYLESSKDKPNTEIYAKFGFRKMKEINLEVDGTKCKLFSMIRDPQPIASGPAN